MKKVTVYFDENHNTVEVKNKILSVLPDARSMDFDVCKDGDGDGELYQAMLKAEEDFADYLINEILKKTEGKTPDGAYYNNGRNDREKEIIEIIKKQKKKNTTNQKPHKVITLCGSTKFKDAFYETQKRLTLEGCIVISVGLFGHSGDNEALNDEIKTMLDDMQKRKIDMADEIFVIDVDGYIGSSTRSEIEYAKKHNKPISYLSECK